MTGRLVSSLVRWRRRGLRTPRTREGIKYADPLHAGRHPFQTYLLALCVVSGFPLVFGVATPRTIEDTLPDWLVIVWGVALFMGAGAALVGSYWPGDYANALTIERIGLVSVGVAGLIYGGVLLYATGWAGFLAGCITIGFGLSCIVRARDIGHIIQVAIAELRSHP